MDVLRVGHRPGRDPRLTTHLALAARALGARRMFLHPPDVELGLRVAALGRAWGGRFEVVPTPDWKRVIRDARGPVVHLTMYGEPLDIVLPDLPRSGEVLVVVGGAKVPSDLYRLATRNVAVGHQPHSEVAALSVFLARWLGVPGPGAWPGARQKIVPRKRGKKVVQLGRPRSAGGT